MGQENDYKVFDGRGDPKSLDHVIGQTDDVDVTFFGEQHDDSVGHRLQSEIFKKIVKRNEDRRQIALSLEMFERDIQEVLNEYLSGKITEKQFMEASRPWKNYKTDYRPLVEYAKEKEIPVIAANAPRRYVNMVSRLGRDSLNGLSAEAKKWIAPLPYGQASDAYGKKFDGLMASMSDAAVPASHNPIIHSQALWDATMAFSISEYLKRNDNGLVVHLNGSFHTENRLGTPDHLMKYKSGSTFIVVTVRYQKDFKNFNKATHANLGDYVILTDASAPRSKR